MPKHIKAYLLGLRFYLFFYTSLFVGCSLPEPKKEGDNTKASQTSPTSEKSAKQEGIITFKSDWFSLKEKKVERFIEKKIEGEWDRIFEIQYDEGSFTKVPYQIGTGNYYQEKFVDGILPKYSYKFMSNSGPKSNSDKPNSYSIDGPQLTIIDISANNEKETVLFIGEALLVRKGGLEHLNSGEYSFCKKNELGNEEAYNVELEEFLNSLLFKSGEIIQSSASMINNNKSLEGYKNLAEGISYLNVVRVIDTSKSKTITELNGFIKSQINLNFDTFITEEAVKSNQKITQLQSGSKVFYIEGISEQLAHLNDLKFLASSIGASVKSVQRIINDFEKLYTDESKKLKLYGDGEEDMMKYAASEYIKTIAKNPNSIEIIKSGVQKKAKNGIIYSAVYRGQNSFGGYTIETISVLLNYDIDSRTFFVVKQL